MMKNICLIIIMGFSTALFAQHTSLTIESERYERFWVYINGQQQNINPGSSIQVNTLYPDRDYNLHIVIDNNQRSETKTVIRLHPGDNNYTLSFNPRNGQISLITVNANINTSFFAGQPAPQYGYPTQHGNYNHQYPAQGHYHPQGHNYYQHYNPPQVVVVEHPISEPVIMPCSDADFIGAKRTIEKASFEETKLTIAKQIVASELMTARQLAEIARLFSFESTKLEFLKFAYQYCYDQNKYYIVNNVFNFSSSIYELNEYINQ
ncbi:MAG: DUF4476 domain-containing protein [Bacteroidales bacterium]|nr:DUF4476 domain-containing protein [Bacteroidales bacterium]